MKLVKNARAIVLRAHSMRAQYLALVWLFSVDLLFLATGIDLNPALVWIVAFGLAVYGLLGRVWDQGLDS